VALVLAPAASAASQARLAASLTDAPADGMAEAALDGLRLSIPAARSLRCSRTWRGAPAGRWPSTTSTAGAWPWDVSACR